MKNKIFAALTISLFLIAFFIYVNRRVIFQLGNPVQYLSKALLLNKNKVYIDVFGDKNVYITKQNHRDIFIDFIEKEYGVVLKEQGGSGYALVSDSLVVRLSSQIYMRYYIVWSVDIDK